MSSISMLIDSDKELLVEIRQNLRNLFRQWATKVREDVDAF